MQLLPSGVKKTHIKLHSWLFGKSSRSRRIYFVAPRDEKPAGRCLITIQKHPRYGRGVFCCGGCRRANSHNILFLVLFWYLFFGVMFVFVTFAVHKIHDWVIKRKSYDEKTTIWGKGGRILRI